MTPVDSSIAARKARFLRQLGLAASFMLVALWLLSCGVPRGPESKRTKPGVIQTSNAAPDETPRWAETTYELCGAPAQLQPFGTQTVAVSAASYGTNSGLYVAPGDTITVGTSGQWTIWTGETAPFSAAGLDALGHLYNCPKGALVARIGDHYKQAPICIGANAEIVADRAGLVYFAMNDDSSPLYHGGSIDVTITSNGLAAAILGPDDLDLDNLCAVGSPLVELRSDQHHSFVVPTATVMRDYASASETLMYFDQAYDDLSQLSDANLPYGGQRIRWLADSEVRAYGWLVGGNPIRYDPKNLDGEAPARTVLLRSSQTDMSLWDFYLGFGHSFSRVLGTRFHADLASSRAWSKLFASFAMQAADRTDSRMPVCDSLSLQQADDSDIKTCLLFELQAEHGWGLITQFYERVSTVANWDLVLAPDATPAAKWDWFESTVNDITGTDNGAVFRKYDTYLD